MPRSSADVVGLGILKKRLAALPDALDRAHRAAVRAEVHNAAEDMRRFAPRDRGGLVAGIRERNRRNRPEGEAASTADYTTYVVHGTSDQRAQDFITPAAERSRQRFPREVAEAVNAELRKITS